MFGRGNRFDNGNGQSEKGSGMPRVEYLSFSDFIKQQFLKERNIFDATSDRPTTASGKVEKYLQDEYLNTFRRVSRENVDHVDNRPHTTGTVRLDSNKFSINTSLLHQEPETLFSSPPRPKKKIQQNTKRTVANKASQIAVVRDQDQSISVNPSTMHSGAIVRNGVDIHPPTPGPGQYYQPTTLVKPSFNRVYTEPEPALPLSKAATLAHTHHHYSRGSLSGDTYSQSSSHGKKSSDARSEYRPAWDQSSPSPANRSMLEEEKSNIREKYKGAYFNNAKFRLKSAPPSSSHRRSHNQPKTAWAETDDSLKESFPLTFRVKDATQILNDDGIMMENSCARSTTHYSPQPKIAKNNELLYGKRYPALSDDQLNRWKSVYHTTYDNKSKQKLPIAMRLLAGKVANKTKKNHFA